MEASFISAAVLLLLVFDPFGNVPIFISALREVAPARRRAVILRECLMGLILAAIAVELMLRGVRAFVASL